LRIERLYVVLDGGDADERLGRQRAEALQIADERVDEAGLRRELAVAGRSAQAQAQTSRQP
jgi:hypothetical protein